MKDDLPNELQKSYFDVLGICCPAEVPMIEKILKPLEGIHHVSVIVPTRTVIVVHDAAVISQFQIVKALNKARLEANVRMKGDQNYGNKWPSPYAVACGVLLLLSFLEYVYSPFKWLALGAVAVGIIPLTLKALASLRNLRFDINLLMLIAVGGSISLKDYWEAGTIVFLLNISEWLEARASHKATAVMSSLMNIAPQNAVLAETGEEVNVNEVKVDTRLAVKAGTMIPIDGIVVEGKCEVDEKTLTGESFPVCKQVDSIVYAGTLNINGYVTVKTTVLAEACVVARMAKLVEEAQNNKSKTQRYVDEFAKYYTPAVVVVAASLAVVPAAMRAHNLDKWYHVALVVLVSACPCGLILSTPIAAFCALSKAATSGVLVKGAEYLETLSKVKFICFDKTGTITKGEFSVTDFRPLIDANKLLYWVSSIESKSNHPMAEALVGYAQCHSVEPQPDNVEEFKDFPGEGIYGKIDGKDVYIGSQKIGVRAGCSQVMSQSDNKGRSTAYVFLGSSPAGIFCLSDSTRIGVKEALEELKSMGIKTTMLTGDCQEAADYAQNQLGGALDIIHAGLLPQDKAKIIEDIQRESRVAMVGDGLNDAPALATADIGIAMGVSGSALANETGHVILMSNDIRKIPIAVRLARRTRQKIFENIFIAMVIKAVVIALAIAGHPLVWAAVLADMGTCLVVIFNSMFLLRGATSRTMKKNFASSQCVAKSMVKDNGGFGLEVKEESCDVSGCDPKVEDNCCDAGGCRSKVKDKSYYVVGCGSEATEKCCKVGSCGSQLTEKLHDEGAYCVEVKDNCCDVGGCRSIVKDKNYDVGECGSKAKDKGCKVGGSGSQITEKLHDKGAYYSEVKDNCCDASGCRSKVKDKKDDVGGYGTEAKEKCCNVGCASQVIETLQDVDAYYLEVKDSCCDTGSCRSKVKDKSYNVVGCGSEAKDKFCNIGGGGSQDTENLHDVGAYYLEVKDNSYDTGGYSSNVKDKCCNVSGGVGGSQVTKKLHGMGDCYVDVKDNGFDMGGCSSKVKDKSYDVVGCDSEAKDKCCNVNDSGSQVTEKLHDVGAYYLAVKDNGCDVDKYGLKVKENGCDVGCCGSVAKDKNRVMDSYGPEVKNMCTDDDVSSLSLEVKDNCCDMGGCGYEVQDNCCNVGGSSTEVKEKCCDMDGCGSK